ncbi:apolipoprotein C-IV [Eucyclogobius newberryi]|uniref:apolipoprotein C-IV n=1 Tax=Eucyclogobius newberryi TaxID=166745 RepID=UPI003B5A6E52
MYTVCALLIQIKQLDNTRFIQLVCVHGTPTQKMDKRSLVLGLILLIQASGPLLAQSTDPPPPGLMQRLTERAIKAREKVQHVREAVLGFAGTYYEDHLQPAAASYYEWASGWRDSLWDTMHSRIKSYNPFGEK